jgi:hypothetical protein
MTRTRTLFGLAAAGLLLVGTASSANAQISIGVGNPYTGSGVYVGPSPYGYTYSSGYLGVRPAVPAPAVVYPSVATVPAPVYAPVVPGAYGVTTYRYPVAGVYRYRYRPFYRRGRIWAY